MSKELLKTWMVCLALIAPVACDEDEGGDDSGGDSANATEGGADEGMESSSQEVCDSRHECINGACTCQTPSLEDAPCTDEDACVDECEICS